MLNSDYSVFRLLEAIPTLSLTHWGVQTDQIVPRHSPPAKALYLIAFVVAVFRRRGNVAKSHSASLPMFCNGRCWRRRRSVCQDQVSAATWP